MGVVDCFSTTPVLFLFLTVRNAVVSGSDVERRFQAAPDLRDNLYTTDLLFTSTASSMLDCSTQCSSRQCCVTFSFYPQDGLCRGHFSWIMTGTVGDAFVGSVTYLWNHPHGTEAYQAGSAVSNVARGKTATQGSSYSTYFWQASEAVDGSYNADLFYSGVCSHTAENGYENWWRVDLAGQYDIYSVVIKNRGDCCGERLNNFDILIHADLASPSTLCHHHTGSVWTGALISLPCCYGPVTGRYVTIQNGGSSTLALCEVDIMAVPHVSR